MNWYSSKGRSGQDPDEKDGKDSMLESATEAHLRVADSKPGKSPETQVFKRESIRREFHLSNLLSSSS